MRPPHRHQIYDTATLNQDHVLAKKVGADVVDVRLREQQQGAEHDLWTPLGELAALRLHGRLRVANRRRDVTQPRRGRYSRDAERMHGQVEVCPAILW